MRGKIGQILEAAGADDPQAHAGAPADVTLRRFWSQGPGVRSCDRTAQVIDLAAWKKAMEAVAR
jgi:hypothetical protein